MKKSDKIPISTNSLIKVIKQNTNNDKFINLIIYLSFSNFQFKEKRVFDYYEDKDVVEIRNFIQFLSDGKVPINVVNIFLENISENIKSEFKTSITNLALNAGSEEVLGKMFRHPLFYNTEDLYFFIRTVEENENMVDLFVKERTLLSLSKLILSPEKFEPDEYFIKLLRYSSDIIQPVLLKYLFYLYYTNKISKTKMLDLIENIQWTDISAVIIITFLKLSEYNEKILVDELNKAFIKHFNIKKDKGISKYSLSEKLSISQIVPHCDGRKHYNAEYWSKHGTTRWYVNDEISISRKESMNCFCEGRPWKKESFWYSGTNQQTNEKYDFYWCKTSYCAQRNDNVNYSKRFFHWTMVEIVDLMNIKIEKHVLAVLAGWANRINEILSNLYCFECGEVLRPIAYTPTSLGFYAVPLFHCINPICSEHQKPIRFTHCFNGKCHKTLDSRKCNKCCSTGLICPDCGTPCPSCSGHNTSIFLESTW